MPLSRIELIKFQDHCQMSAMRKQSQSSSQFPVWPWSCPTRTTGIQVFLALDECIGD
jgi:hypothetical protein